MKQRLIDANAYAAEMKVRQDALKELMDDADALENWEMYDGLSRAFSVFVEAKLTLDAIPTVDAVQVVRCKECKWAEVDAWFTYCKLGHKEDTTNSIIYTCTHDFFCADGERRTECIKP